MPEQDDESRSVRLEALIRPSTRERIDRMIAEQIGEPSLASVVDQLLDEAMTARGY
jgi:hypothetical protein